MLITLLYAFLVLGAALAGSYKVYQWARWSVVASYPLVSAASQPITQPSNPGIETTTGASAVVDDTTTTAAAQPVAPAIPPVNVLLLGTDGRADENGPPRTDTMIVLALDPTSETAGMLSLPRDLWVPIPSHEYNAKINMAYNIGEREHHEGGGAQLAMDTVSQFIGRPVDYYVRINFQGFVKIVDLIGGIDILVPKVIHDEEYPTSDYGVETFHLDAGLQHLDGETALKYARTRHIDDDYGRARRQQDVIRAVVDKVLRADMIPTLLPKAWMLFSTMRSSIETNIPIPVQIELAGYMRSAALQEIRQEVLDNRYGEEKITEDAGWILIPDRQKVRAAMDHFFTPPTLANGVAALTDPQWVRIEVLNGTGQPGVAARTRAYLEAKGWHVVAIGDADRSDYDSTIVINYGVPQSIVSDVSTTLDLQPARASLQGLNSSHPVDLRIVVGRDLLPQLP
ncbi:MAG: LCP family protein [Caldilineaceae bacterium]